MDFEHLHEFTELAKRLNFTETARFLHMSQPTLSKHISALEKELRISLFDRNGTKLALTQAGQALLPYVYKIAESKNEAVEAIQMIKKSTTPLLRIGGVTDESASFMFIGAILQHLGNKYGNHFAEIIRSHHLPPSELILKNKADICLDYISTQEMLGADIEVVDLCRLPLAAVIDRSHPLADYGSLDLIALKDMTFIKLEGNDTVEAWHHIERACAETGFFPKSRSVYFKQLTDLLGITAELKDDVLVLTRSTVKRMGQSFSPQCLCIPLTSTEAYMPFGFSYKSDNYNPVLEDVLTLFADSSIDILSFAETDYDLF